MAVESSRDAKPLFADKAELIRIMDEQNRRVGFVPDPTATIERLRERMLADGVRPEDCIGSREVIRMREE